MSKSQDITIIIAFAILIIFAIFTTLYFFKYTNIKSNSETNISETIYEEHIHEHESKNNIVTEQIVYTDIASYSTQIQDKDKNRIYNIKRACKKLDGHIVEPSEEFSFNTKMGTMGAADGYKKAIGFDSNGNKIKMYGGGICQISSTLYNAVLIANLEVTERHAHSRRVYYVPKNKDATVFSGGPDFKFKNTTNANIMICTSTDGNNVTVTLKQETITQT